MNWNQKIAVAVADFLVIIELCIGIYFANQDPDNFNPIFFKTFLSMLIPTLVTAKIFVKKLRTPGAAEPEPAR